MVVSVTVKENFVLDVWDVRLSLILGANPRYDRSYILQL
jgi:hypothetical protein